MLATLSHNPGPAKRGNLPPAPIHIGSNAWFGVNVTVLPSVTIGDGAIIAAGTAVTKDMPENTVVAVVSAKIIKEVPHK